MAITPDQTAEASDFINESEADAVPANDAGRVPKLESDGKLSPYFVRGINRGDGSDGVLNIPSGTTYIDCNYQNIVVKNYSSIDIASGATLALENTAPNGTILVLKCLGLAEIEGTIDLRGAGGKGGFAGYTDQKGDGFDGFSLSQVYCLGGKGAFDSNAGAGGIALTTGIREYAIFESDNLGEIGKLGAFCGAGGGGGRKAAIGGNKGQGGRGGSGGGGLIFISSKLDFSGTINTSGENGQNGEAKSGNSSSGGGAGGGGSAGLPMVLTNKIIANTGTIIAEGGDGGTGGNATATSTAGASAETAPAGGGASGIRDNGGSGGAYNTSAGVLSNGAVGSAPTELTTPINNNGSGGAIQTHNGGSGFDNLLFTFGGGVNGAKANKLTLRIKKQGTPSDIEIYIYSAPFGSYTPFDLSRCHLIKHIGTLTASDVTTSTADIEFDFDEIAIPSSGAIVVRMDGTHNGSNYFEFQMSSSNGSYTVLFDTNGDDIFETNYDDNTVNFVKFSHVRKSGAGGGGGAGGGADANGTGNGGAGGAGGSSYDVEIIEMPI